MNGRSSTFGGLLAIVIIGVIVFIGLVQLAPYLDGYGR